MCSRSISTASAFCGLRSRTRFRSLDQILPSSTRRAVLIALFLAATTSAVAQPAQDFYRGKTVNLLIGIQAGGAYDAYARLLARHIGRHIPGEPLVVVQNMP